MSKLRVGWFSFSCCEDSTILFTELLNDHWLDWKNKIEFINARVFKKALPIENLDIAFVEGAITSEVQARKLQEIRAKSKNLIAVGACAVIAMPSGWRNTFSEEQKEKVAPLISRFAYASKVEPLKSFVRVDAEVPGCPMDEKIFLTTLSRFLDNELNQPANNETIEQ